MLGLSVRIQPDTAGIRSTTGIARGRRHAVVHSAPERSEGIR
jgi:hypothetical protein